MTATQLLALRELASIIEDDKPALAGAVRAATEEIERLADELHAVRDELATAYEEIILSRQSEGDTMADLLATREDRDRLRAELAARPVAVEVPDQRRTEPFVRENRFLVLKWADIETYGFASQKAELRALCAAIRIGRTEDGRRLDSYVVVADDWPEYEETWAKIEARVTGQPIDPSRILKDGEVAVPGKQWTIAQMLANAWSLHPLKCDERDALVTEWDDFTICSGEAEGRKG